MAWDMLTPEELISALQASTPLVAPRASGKRATLSILYYLQQFIRLEEKYGKTTACEVQPTDETEWISVAERFPDDKEKQPGHGFCNVLVTYKYRGIWTVEKCTFVAGKFFLPGSKQPIYPVAWRPLPKPYKPF